MFFFDASELQALLKCCLEVNMEDVRRSGKPWAYLFCTVQRRMARYGNFPARKLVNLRHKYLYSQKDFMKGKLNTPEAHSLWGHFKGLADSDMHSIETNETELLKRKPAKITGKLESIKNSRKGRRGINVRPEERRTFLENCLRYNVRSMGKKGLLLLEKVREKMVQDGFPERTVCSLTFLYKKTRQAFRHGRLTIPEAEKLWGSHVAGNDSDCAKDESMSEAKMESNNDQSQFGIEFCDNDSSIIRAQEPTRNCSICKTSNEGEMINLLAQSANGTTYWDIIQDCLNIQISCDDIKLQICENCSSFIEDLYEFVAKCRKSLIELSVEASDGAAHIEETISDPFHGFDEDGHEPLVVKDEIMLSEIDLENFNIAEAFENNDIYSQEQPEEQEEDSVVSETGDPEYLEEPLNIELNLTEEQIRKQTREFTASMNKPARQCDVCGVVIRGGDLAGHMQIHSGKQFPCRFCDRVFGSVRYLRRHENIHTKERKYNCQYCDRVFYIWKTWKGHEAQHTADKYKCSECGNEYSTKLNLDTHYKFKHLRQCKFHCKQCEFVTNIKKRLLHHVRCMHTDLRPFGCPFCDNTTSNDANHYVHFQRHKKSGEATVYQIKCAYCGELFLKDAAFETHLVKHHPDKIVEL
ncbi:zinc finger protein 236-like [Uranotaenia lowii]|uniref:zinc finger protein 236-like n=1 Tax=Uranotaenia lowii TaxID=190385 RepID=UPI0024788EFB|nr:zinc finger protein 236-like [Uranotaenia lowii]